MVTSSVIKCCPLSKDVSKGSKAENKGKKERETANDCSAKCVLDLYYRGREQDDQERGQEIKGREAGVSDPPPPVPPPFMASCLPAYDQSTCQSVIRTTLYICAYSFS